VFYKQKTGDALLTYENEVIMTNMSQAPARQLPYVVPQNNVSVHSIQTQCMRRSRPFLDSLARLRHALRGAAPKHTGRIGRARPDTVPSPARSSSPSRSSTATWTSSRPRRAPPRRPSSSTASRPRRSVNSQPAGSGATRHLTRQPAAPCVPAASCRPSGWLQHMGQILPRMTAPALAWHMCLAAVAGRSCPKWRRSRRCRPSSPPGRWSRSSRAGTLRRPSFSRCLRCWMLMTGHNTRERTCLFACWQCWSRCSTACNLLSEKTGETPQHKNPSC
jgi:hypothetical protein